LSYQGRINSLKSSVQCRLPNNENRTIRQIQIERISEIIYQVDEYLRVYAYRELQLVEIL